MENSVVDTILHSQEDSTQFFRSASTHNSPTSSHLPADYSSKVRQNVGRNATFSHPTPRFSKTNTLKTSENVKVPLLDKTNEKKKVVIK